MKTLLIKLRNFLIKLKVYMGRTGSYIGLINTAMILFLFLSNLEKYGIDVDIKDWMIPIFIFGVIGMLTFGFLEYKFFYGQEQKTTQSRSPYFKEIMERLDRIEKKIGKKK